MWDDFCAFVLEMLRKKRSLLRKIQNYILNQYCRLQTELNRKIVLLLSFLQLTLLLQTKMQTASWFPLFEIQRALRDHF